jgi:hypothetical protein
VWVCVLKAATGSHATIDHMNKHLIDEDRTTAIGLARFAYEYIDAAMLIDQQHGALRGFELVSPTPAYFLALHGIELSLKAFLRHRGVSVRELRSPRHFGHDLRRCYRKAKELGLREIFRMRADDMRAMLMLLDLNEFQGLRYIRTGLKRFPSWAIVEPFAVRLHQAVAVQVGYKSFGISYPAYR